MTSAPDRIVDFEFQETLKQVTKERDTLHAQWRAAEKAIDREVMFGNGLLIFLFIMGATWIGLSLFQLDTAIHQDRGIKICAEALSKAYDQCNP